MPKGAKLLRFDVLKEEEVVSGSLARALTLWAEVESNNVKEKRVFKIYGTGDEIKEDAKYVGTAFDKDGVFVWHLYELSR
jgi:hypothetical protein